MKRISTLSASLGLAVTLASVATAAVPTLEISSAGGDTTATGPTITPQENTYSFNPDNPNANTFSQNYFPKTKVTYSFQNQQYPNGNESGLFFGDNIGTVAERSIFIPLGGQGSPQDSNFTSSRLNPSMGTGINIKENYGTRIVLNASRLGSTYSLVTTGLGIYFGDIVVRFSKPIKNPVINLSGMGGSIGRVGITANFSLKEAPSGTSIRLLSGSGLHVEQNNIKNNSTRYGALTGSGGASGSVQVENTNTIESLTFSVYIASDATSGSGWGNSGDAFVFSASSVDSMVGDLVISKSNEKTQVYSGDTTTYTVRVTNNGPDTYSDTQLKDVLGTGLTATAVACSTAANNKCSTTPTVSNLNSISTGALAAGEFYEILVTARVDAAAGNKIINTASVTPPTLGSSTGVGCRTPLTGDTTGLKRSFDEGTGTCTMSDEDTVLPAADLEISKTSDKTTYNTGDVVQYTIKAWNNGALAVTDAILTDEVPTNIAGLSWACTPSGSAVCPPAANMTVLQNSNKLTATDLNLPANGKDTHYLTFTITGLAYKAGSVANNASIKTNVFDRNLANNTATANMTITQNASITAGKPQNQCLSGQAVNLVSDTGFSRYDADKTLSSKNYDLKTAGSNPSIAPHTIIYGTGTNGAIELKGRLSWSHGAPRTNTTGATMRVLVDGVVYAVLVTPGRSSNNTASFNALNGAQVSTPDYALTSYRTDPGSINFNITLPTTITNVKTVQTEFQSYSGSGMVGDDIGIGLNELNACLKPTFEMNKVSENGTDLFNFDSFSNLTNSDTNTITSGEVVTTLVGAAQSVRLKTSTSPVEAGSLLAYALPNTAIRFAESDSTLYSLKTIECKDTNAAISGNTTGNLGSLSGLTQTIPAENVKFASKLVCRVTNSKKAGYVFSGRVFNDNSGSTLDVNKAYNGKVDPGEEGIAGSLVELQDCKTKTTLASTTTNANGDFKIQTLDNVFAGRTQVCLVQQNLTGFDSVSSSKSDTSTATIDSNDQFSIAQVNNVSSYEGFLFGDAELKLVLNQNGQKTIVAGDVVDYPHELTAKSVINIVNLSQSKEQQPANNQPWQSLVYVDSNCNGRLDQGENLFTNRILQANEKICLVQRVVSPTTAQGGDRFIANFKVTGQATYSNAPMKDSNSVNDITTIGTAGLTISKLVRTTSNCPAPSTENTSFSTANQASKGDYLEYQITYSNASNKNLVDVVLKDSVPLGTIYGSMSCTASGCQTQETSGQLKWTIPGILSPKQTGNVGFCVRIPK